MERKGKQAAVRYTNIVVFLLFDREPSSSLLLTFTKHQRCMAVHKHNFIQHKNLKNVKNQLQ
jgi:hypothetical protein